MIQIQHRYGYTPDLMDFRDYPFKAKAHLPVVLPIKVDLRPGCSLVEDQGELGSCTANALVGALEYNEIKCKTPFADMSRLFIYYNERVIEGSIKTDSGAQIRDGIKTLAKQGCCTEKLWPYNIEKFAAKPSSACYKDGLTRTIQSYARLNTIDEMRACLAGGEPFVFGFSVYESFESSQVAKTGIVPMPTKKEKLLGGHAVLAVGYDDIAKRFIVRNSWGASWGQAGYCLMPYDYLISRDLSDDFWQITK